MAKVEYRLGWQCHDQELIEDARQFWRDMDVMSEQDIDARSHQLCALAYVDGKVAAASTVRLHDYTFLRARFAYYRTIVSPDFRRQNLASNLCAYSHDRLAQWAREKPEEKLKGLFIVLQAEEFEHRQHVPVIVQLDLRLVLVGYTQNGYQMRVVWFDDAIVE